MTITVEGPLLGAPRRGRWGADDYVVTLRIDAGRHCAPFEVRIPCGTGAHGSIVAEQTASLLRAGELARAVGVRLDLVTDHGDIRYALRECTSVVVGWRECL